MNVNRFYQRIYVPRYRNLVCFAGIDDQLKENKEKLLIHQAQTQIPRAHPVNGRRCHPHQQMRINIYASKWKI